MTDRELPRFLTELVDELAAATGVVAVVPGGSRALDTRHEEPCTRQARGVG